MSDRPLANAASHLMVAVLERMNSFEEWPETPTRVAAEFVLDDRRRGGIGVGRVDRDVAMAYSQTAWEIGSGPPIQRVRRVLATLGDRLVAAHIESDTGQWESESIMVWRIDSQLRNLQVAVIFDADDVDAAIAELDRMHVAMEAEPATPS